MGEKTNFALMTSQLWLISKTINFCLYDQDAYVVPLKELWDDDGWVGWCKKEPIGDQKSTFEMETWDAE